MNLKRLVGVCMLVSACGSTERPANQTADPRPANQPADTWDRTRQCAERGDTFAKEMRADMATGPTHVSDWTTHYNVTYRRCYVLVGFFNLNAATDRGSPLSFQQVYDAFERRDLAQFTSQRLDVDGQKVWCQQTDEQTGDRTSPPCEAVAKYVAQLMLK